MKNSFLDSDIKYLPGVGPKRAEVLNKELEIFNFGDLFYYFPYKYIDRTKIYKTTEIDPDLPYIQLKGKIYNLKLLGEKRTQRLVAELHDDFGSVELVWFQGVKWVKDNLKADIEYLVFGKPNEFNGKINIAHPDLEDANKPDNRIKAAWLSAYNTTETMKRMHINSKAIQKMVENLFLSLTTKFTETLPDYLIEKYKFISLHEALFNMHFPQNTELLKKSQARLKFEELFYLQINILRQRNLQTRNSKGNVFEVVGSYFNDFYKNNLKFELTDAQKRVLKEIRKDFGSGKQTNRLLQGDVGSGKTLVALMCMLMALDNGFQATMMAPTEILAQQHFKTIQDFLAGMDIKIALLTGSTKTKQRKQIHEQLLNGELQILLGTHALIEDTVQFKNLGLVIVDEQHRFGVAQRARLWTKNTNAPHIIVMSATPIPRTLAMTLYGDLDVSVIDQLPPGRKPIITHHSFDTKRAQVYNFIKQQIAAGRQIYIVYPLIKESEAMDYKNLEEGYEHITQIFQPPHYKVSVVHGKMKNEDKDKSMQLFANGETNIMVATTVIEVGVNVPNATVMIIESAERFGLSQLHQLRGRVGRGGEQSYCILMTSHKLSKEAKLRMQTMVRTNDGFEIAEVDLKLRGPGDLEGTQQSGIPIQLKIANIAKDTQYIELARKQAMEILNDDPLLEKEENKLIAEQIKIQQNKKINMGMIS